MDTVSLMCDWFIDMLMTYTSVALGVFGQRCNRMMYSDT